MDVDRTSFWSLLPTLLKHIAESDAIAFDLELSGIPPQKRRRLEQLRDLNDRYKEVKAAAEKYHILQVGLTCIREEPSGSYALRTYNFNLSPLLGFDDFGMERDFTFSSSAVEFLVSHGYQMDAPYLFGIPYLTPSETEAAENLARQKWDRSAIPDISVRSTDKVTLAFMEKVKQTVQTWKEASQPRDDYIDIVGGVHPDDSSARIPLNPFQRRIVHQVVRSNFPELRTSTRIDFVRISEDDATERKSLAESVGRRIQAAVSKYVGFRWVAKAMVGGDLSKLDTDACARSIHGEPKFANAKLFHRRFQELCAQLENRRRVLIGHNCLLDVVYFYRVFYGDLPESLADFKDALTSLFPTIIDTKYLASICEDSHKFANLQLWELHEALATQSQPIIITPEAHSRYGDSGKDHEAGFDSLVTAKVFLKLATRLASKVGNQPNDKQSSDHGNMSSKSVDASSNEQLGSGTDTDRTMRKEGRPGGQTALYNHNISPNDPSTVQNSKFSHRNRFTSLADPEESILANTETEMDESPVSSSKAIGARNLQGELHANEGLSVSTQSTGLGKKDFLVTGQSALWSKYGNRIKVNGTIEGFLSLCNEQSALGGHDVEGSPDV